MELAEELAAFFRNGLDLEITDKSAPLISSGLVDSMQILEVAMIVEKHLGSPIQEDDMVVENFESLQAMLDFVDARTS